MTLKQMQYYISVCKTQNLAKSAEELYISQPTLSISMRELEREVGTILFQKKGTHITLTEAGNNLAAEISSVLQQYEKMNSFIRAGNLNRTYVRFGFSTFAGNSFAALLCRQFHKKHPDIRVQITEDFGGNLLWKLQNNQLDVVLTGSNYASKPQWKGKFKTHVIGSDSLTYCVCADSPMAKKESVTMAEIASNPVIMLNDSFPISKTIERLFDAKGFPLNIVLRSSQLYTVEQFISTGVAGGFLHEIACESNNNIVSLPCIELNALRNNSVSLFWNERVEVHQSLSLFLSQAKRLK